MSQKDWENCSVNDISCTSEIHEVQLKKEKGKVEHSQCLSQHQAHLGRSISCQSLLENSLRKSPKGQKRKALVQQMENKRHQRLGGIQIDKKTQEHPKSLLKEGFKQ